jgi:exosortase/archaeosortase family protein
VNQQHNPLKFALLFITLFMVFYYFNILFFRATNHGPHNIAILADHFNYIRWLRWLLLGGSAQLLKLFGYGAISNNYELLVAGHGAIKVVYTCLGFGVLSFYAAFVLAYPKPVKSKIIALVIGIAGVEFLNIIRFMLLALYGNNGIIDHHTLFNIIIYVIISIGLYFWIKRDITIINKNETN